jgi:hypothetical protein
LHRTTELNNSGRSEFSYNPTVIDIKKNPNAFEHERYIIHESDEAEGTKMAALSYHERHTRHNYQLGCAESGQKTMTGTNCSEFRTYGKNYPTPKRKYTTCKPSFIVFRTNDVYLMRFDTVECLGSSISKFLRLIVLKV